MTHKIFALLPMAAALFTAPLAAQDYSAPPATKAGAGSTAIPPPMRPAPPTMAHWQEMLSGSDAELAATFSRDADKVFEEIFLFSVVRTKIPVDKRGDLSACGADNFAKVNVAVESCWPMLKGFEELNQVLALVAATGYSNRYAPDLTSGLRNRAISRATELIEKYDSRDYPYYDLVVSIALISRITLFQQQYDADAALADINALENLVLSSQFKDPDFSTMSIPGMRAQTKAIQKR